MWCNTTECKVAMTILNVASVCLLICNFQVFAVQPLFKLVVKGLNTPLFREGVIRYNKTTSNVPEDECHAQTTTFNPLFLSH